jgi:SNF2 family DNA or RNA helicase
MPGIPLGTPTHCSVPCGNTGRAVSLTLDKPARSASGPANQAAADPGAGDDLLRRLIAALQPPLELLYRSAGVLQWPMPLLPYQQGGIATLVRSSELLLADDMGLGKTVQAIGALRVLFLRQEIPSALVVCPSSLVRQWAQELRLWAPELNTVAVAGPSPRPSLWRRDSHVKLVSYETLRSDLRLASQIPWGVVVLDEASRIKNRDTSLAHACKKLSSQRRWALTGTPLENRLEDVVSVLEFLGGKPQRYPSRQQVLERLGEVQLRRRKADVLPQLPARLVREIEVELGPAQRRAYEEAEQDGVVQLRAHGPALRVTHILELITRLKQICNYHPASGESSKLQDIAQRIEVLVAEGHRALVFSQFTDEVFGVGLICRLLQAHRPLAYTGALTCAQRAAVTDRFLGDSSHKLLVLSLRAGGVGLNLQSASYVFHLDRWWNPAIEEQADSRAHRMGQRQSVHAFRYVCLGTIEERIAAILRSKRQLFDEIVDEVSIDLATTLTQAELRGLFGLDSPGS